MDGKPFWSSSLLQLSVSRERKSGGSKRRECYLRHCKAYALQELGTAQKLYLKALFSPPFELSGPPDLRRPGNGTEGGQGVGSHGAGQSYYI